MLYRQGAVSSPKAAGKATGSATMAKATSPSSSPSSPSSTAKLGSSASAKLPVTAKSTQSSSSTPPAKPTTSVSAKFSSSASPSSISAASSESLPKQATSPSIVSKSTASTSISSSTAPKSTAASSTTPAAPSTSAKPTSVVSSTSTSSTSSKISLGSYSSFKFSSENEKILEGTYLRVSGGNNSGNSLQKLRACLTSRDMQVWMNAVAIAGMSVEQGQGLKEIFALLGDGDAWVVANICAALINVTVDVKQKPNSPATTELVKVSVANWSEIGQFCAALPSAGDQRINVLKFLANSLAQPSIISNFLKSSALGSLCSCFWTGGSGTTRPSSSDEEQHALLIVVNNLVVSSKPSEFKKLCEDGRFPTSLTDLFTSSMAANKVDRVNIILQIVSSLCQEPTSVLHFAGKDKPFVQALISALRGQKNDEKVVLRLVRLCSTLMQQYEPTKLLIAGGVFRFYAACLRDNSSTIQGEEIQMAILATLANLALNDNLPTTLAQTMHEAKLLHALQELLMRPSLKPDVRIRAGITVSNLMTLETLQTPFTQAGGIKALLTTANKHTDAKTENDAELFQKALSALFHLSLYYDSVRDALVQEGALKSLGSVISTSGKMNPASQQAAVEKARQAAMKTLYNISMTDGHEAEFVKHNVIGPLISVLKANAGDDDATISSGILENLANNSVFHDHLRTTGGVDSIVNLACEGNAKIQERAARLIARLAVNGSTRKYLQTQKVAEKLKKSRTSVAGNVKMALEAALHNIDIPVEPEVPSGTSIPVPEEESAIDKLTKDFDLDDDGSIASLDHVLSAHDSQLFSTPLEGIPQPISKPVTATPASPKHTAMSPSTTARAASSPLSHKVLTPSAPQNTSSSHSPGAKASGPPPVPPKPAPKPAIKKVNAARRAIGSQPPRPAAELAPRLAAMKPKVAVTTAQPTAASSAPPGQENDDEEFEDRGLRKESFMLVGGDAANSPSSKKKKGLLTSLKSIFGSSDDVSEKASDPKFVLHDGPWQINEDIVSQKCPSIIYDYYDNWCESCQRNGSICDNTTEALRQLRIKLIRSRAPKTFPPSMKTETRARSNSDPTLPKTTGIESPPTSASPADIASAQANQESHAPVAEASPSSPKSPRTDDARTRALSTLARPPPPATTPPLMSMPIPQSIATPPVHRPSAGAAQTPAISGANTPTISNTPPNSTKMPSHPPQPSLGTIPPKKKELPADADPELVKRAKMHVKRTHVAQELLTTEGQYMQNLLIIIKKFQAPLQSSLATPKPLITESDIKVIFGSVEIIYNVNMVLIEKLNVKMRRWTTKQTLGDVFLYMADWLKIYTDYINHYDKSQNTLLRCKEDNPRFAQFLMDRTLEPICALRGLETFLVMPIQRPPRYSLLLRELIKNTDQTHPDWADLNAASERIEKITMYLNEKRREFDSRFKMLELAHSLVSLKIRAEIVQPHRENLLQAQVSWAMKTGSKKQGVGRLYLLNDAFLLTKTVGKTRQKLVRLIPHQEVAATIPPFASGSVNDPHLKEITLLNLVNQEFILITFEAVENRDQMYNHYLRLADGQSSSAK